MNALLHFGCHAILIVGPPVFFLVHFKISDPLAIIPGRLNALPGYTVKYLGCLRHESHADHGCAGFKHNNNNAMISAYYM